MLGWSSMFKPLASYRTAWSGSVVILAPGHIPTVDFYLTPRLTRLAPGSVTCFDSSQSVSVLDKLPIGSFVVIVRHASPGWLSVLEQNRHRLSGVAFLMDDDLPSAWCCSDVPLDYGLWTTGRYLIAKSGLAKVCDRVWMSTEALREKFQHIPSSLVEPLAFGWRRSGPAPIGSRRWGYHGTRIHKDELPWLVPLVAKVNNVVPNAEFEIFGDRKVERLFAHVPRVTVLQPRPWPEYVAHCYRSELAIGLAPILPGRFNAMRSHVKAFDIARCGAVGVFSNRPPYATAIEADTAVLLPDDRDAWAAQVIALLQDDTARLTRYMQMSAYLNELGKCRDIEELIGKEKA